MNPLVLAIKEIFHHSKTSLLTALLVGSITGTLTFFAINSRGFEKEVGRNVRDIGSNVVILPSSVDQWAYHRDGGFHQETMPAEVVDQLVEFRASLNHLIPMLERIANCRSGDVSIEARVVGIAASIPLPGRPKAPMQKSVPQGEVQIGAALAQKLGVSREAKEAFVEVNGTTYPVERVNRSNGTWQDSAVFMDLESAQTLFGLPNQLSRIEAIECTQEQCEETGLQSDVLLNNELARITDQALLLRREQMADARLNVRVLSEKNQRLVRNLLWVFLAITIMALATLNSVSRRSEIGVLQSIGYGQLNIAFLFVLRSFLLGVTGSVAGVGAGSITSFFRSRELFQATGGKFTIDWSAGLMIGVIAVALSVIAALIPAMIAATQHPADLIGKER